MNDLHIRRALKSVVLIAALGITAGVLSQCQMVQDNVAGVDLRASQSVGQREECVKNCEERAKDARKAEDDRHKLADRACHSDKVCKKAEEQTHKRNHDAIDDATKDCKRGCYNEGGGKGR